MQKNRPAMNYDKLSRSLRYYYEKGIMQKVQEPTCILIMKACIYSECRAYGRLIHTSVYDGSLPRHTHQERTASVFTQFTNALD